ncbi:MAG: hypothetical protein HY906_00650 [Deltaproteobacteria bacterium]|nr:hypothetical protein [Deltaproteobacteria bacterium]
MDLKDWTVTAPGESAALVERAIKPNAEAIAPIVARGKIAVVVFEPHDEEPIRNLGWDGESPVFQLAEATAERMAQTMHGDRVTQRWLRRRGRGRILIFMHYGTLLLNVDPEKGVSIEPGSTDAGSLN